MIIKFREQRIASLEKTAHTDTGCQECGNLKQLTE
jgi:seryl-tRNA synthetase